MKRLRTIDVSALPAGNVSYQHPLWWGQLFLAFTEGSVFCILLGMYLYIRLSVDVWPPPGIQLPHRLLPGAATLLLVFSCAGTWLASEAAKADDRFGVIWGLLLNLVLAIAAMAVRTVEWWSWNYTWRTTAYGSINWSILFLHTVDVVADLAFTLVLILIFILGKHGPKQRIGVHVDSIVWYFLVLIWIPLYTAVYWGPYITGGAG
ncbi:MAG TPA: cytochrome c oxidase subunit 3 [Bryobacteraceae bacterium]|jgi:heme/copper-type cytochrome/quinol oxidase subunit 3|nr:cytochrome c oxidase subunit 3 [Bryobacteraceae bacterium]